MVPGSIARTGQNAVIDLLRAAPFYRARPNAHPKAAPTLRSRERFCSISTASSVWGVAVRQGGYGRRTLTVARILAGIGMLSAPSISPGNARMVLPVESNTMKRRAGSSFTAKPTEGVLVQRKCDSVIVVV
jgi:hypothetical protein